MEARRFEGEVMWVWPMQDITVAQRASLLREVFPRPDSSAHHLNKKNSG